MLITLSQLPALSILLKDSMATPPGHEALFGIAQGRGWGQDLGFSILFWFVQICRESVWDRIWKVKGEMYKQDNEQREWNMWHRHNCTAKCLIYSFIKYKDSPTTTNMIRSLSLRLKIVHKISLQTSQQQLLKSNLSISMIDESHKLQLIAKWSS